MLTNNSFYKMELHKLQSFEKSLQHYQTYRNPNISDFRKMWKRYIALFDFGEDLSNKAYYKLYRKYADSNKSAYAERLRMHLEYNKEISWFLMRNPIIEGHYIALVNKFQALQNELKIVLIKQFGEADYKVLYQEYEFYLKNT